MKHALMAGYLLLLAMALFSPSQAQITTPTLADGTYLAPSEAPCAVYHSGRSTGTTESQIVAVPGYVAWVNLSTAAATAASYLVLFDTGTLANTDADLNPLGGRHYHASATQNTLIRFQPPMRFVNGLTATKALAADVAAICYRTYGTQVP